MIGFYFTKTGEYDPETIDNIGSSLILDDKNKKMQVMGKYEFDFQRLDASYTSNIDSSAKGLSIFGAGLMYNNILGLIDEGLEDKQDTISDLSTIRSGASAGATAVQPSSLATVATSGSYNDLTDKPVMASTTTCQDIIDELT